MLWGIATKTNKALSKSKKSETLISVPTLIQAFKENLATKQMR